jgi:hypothetical protein
MAVNRSAQLARCQRASSVIFGNRIFVIEMSTVQFIEFSRTLISPEARRCARLIGPPAAQLSLHA